MTFTLEAVVVNQRDLIDKVLARYPEKFTVFRELLQNADDAGAKNFIIDFQTHKCASNGIQPGLDSVKALKWLVKNDGTPFHDSDWNRLKKIAEGNPDERKIGAFGVGFYSVFSVTDKPIVKSNGQMMSVFYKDGKDQLYVQTEKCNRDHWTVIEMELKQESPVPPTFELTRFLVTSMTFLANIERVTISRDGAELSHMIKSRNEPRQSIAIPEHMVRTSRNGTMSINSVELISQEVKVVFAENTLVGAPKVPIAQADLDESERNPTKSRAFFSTRVEDEVPSKPNGKAAAPRYTGAASGAPSLNAGARFSAKCSIYSAHVTASAKHLEKGLRHATKKKPPANFSFEMVFFDKEEHDKQTREGNDTSGSGSVFRGHQGLCPPLQGEPAARIFIGQSTSQTTGIACHMSGRFIPTMERGSIDLADCNGDVAKWNEEVLYVGGFLARVAYDSEMNKVHNVWSTLGNTVARELALYTMKTFTFQPSTPDSKVSIIIRNAFFDSKPKYFLFLSDKGVRHTKDIRQYHADFASFMRNTPVLPDALKSEIKSMIVSLPERLRVKPYTFKDVVKELESRCLPEAEMAACLRWWTNTFGNQGPLNEEHKKFRNELLNAGKALSGGNEIRLSDIQTFIDGRLLNVRNPDDPLPKDTIPPALIQGLNNPTRIQEALGWSEMPITHWLRHLTSAKLDQAHDMTQTFNFASHILTVLSALWYGLRDDSHYEIKEILEGVACIPTTTSSTGIFMRTPKEAYLPEADVFRDLPVVRQELLVDPRMVNMLEFLGVQKRCDIQTFISKAMSGNRWSALDLARYLLTSPEHADHVMGLEIFLCNDGKRRHVKDAFASTDINRQLRLPVVNCDYWDSGYEAQFLVRYQLREYPTIDELIGIASSASESDRQARQVAFSYLCGPQYEARLEREFDPAKFSEYAFIPGVRDGKSCLISHDEVFSDPSWTVFGFGKLPERFDKKIIPKLKIRDRPTATKLFEVLKSKPPKDRQTAIQWFRFLADKGVFSAGEFDKIADLKIVPIPRSSEKQEPDYVSPRECFLKSDSYPENHFYQKLFTFVDFGPSANAFLKACGVKERPECIDILKVLLESPQDFLDKAMDPEMYLVELRMIAVGHKSLPKDLADRMRKARIFLGIQRRSGPQGKDQYKLCKVEEVLVADDMESCRTFGDCIFIAPQEELLEKFYSDMRVKSLSSRIKYTVNPSKEIQDTRSPNADKLRQTITEKIPIFLHEFDEQRFKPGMRTLRWREATQFFVRACGHLRVTKRLDFATEHQHGREQYDTELSAETEEKSGVHVLWIKDSGADSYDIAAALCRMLFSTYKKNDVLSLMTILDTPIDVLERRGYDVKRILKEYDDNLEKAGQGNKMINGCQAPKDVSPPKDVPVVTSGGMEVPRKLKKLWDRLHKDPKLGEVKLSNIAGSIDNVNKIMQEAGGKDNSHISNREKVGGGKKQKNVGYCDEKKVAENELIECGQVGQIKVWKLDGISSDIPSKESEAFGKIISGLAQVFEINQTRCHVFWYPSDSNLMGFNRNDEIFFGLQHYIDNHHTGKGSAEKAYIDWYYIMAHEMAHVHTPYHDEHHELLFAALTAKNLTRLHNLPAVRQVFDCSPNSS